MERFDLNEDGAIEKREITLSGCTVRAGTFEHADKNNNGVLSGKEVRDATLSMLKNLVCVLPSIFFSILSNCSLMGIIFVCFIFNSLVICKKKALQDSYLWLR